MLESRPAHAGLNPPSVAKLTRLVGKAIRYLPRLLRCHDAEKVTIAIKVHEHHVVKVSRTHTTTFGVDGRARSPDPLNVAIRVRLDRLVRRLGIDYGGVNLQIERGVVQQVEPLLSLRPPEVAELLGHRLLPALPALPTPRRYQPLSRFASRRRRRRDR